MPGRSTYIYFTVMQFYETPNHIVVAAVSRSKKG